MQKQQEQAGEVTIGKRVTEHTETVNVPLREERVIIERTAGSGRAVEGAADLKEGQAIEVPVMRETATTSKEAVVTEEVNVRKEVTEREQQVSGTVRKEELVVDGDQNVVTESSRAAGSATRRTGESAGDMTRDAGDAGKNIVERAADKVGDAASDAKDKLTGR